MRFSIVLGTPRAGRAVADATLIERPAKLPRVRAREDQARSDRSLHLPAFGRHHRRAEADPAHPQRLRLQFQDRGRRCASVTGDCVLLLALPIAHNLPLACPGIQGFMFNGGKIVLSRTTRPEEMFPLVAEAQASPISRWCRRCSSASSTAPPAPQHDTSSMRYIQSGGQRLQPEVRLRTEDLIPTAFVQENFGMSEGMLFFVRRDDPEDVRLETVRPPDLARRRGAAARRRRQRRAVRRGRRAVRARPLHAARLLRRARAQSEGLHPRRLLPLGRSDAAASRRATTWSRGARRTSSIAAARRSAPRRSRI